MHSLVVGSRYYRYNWILISKNWWWFTKLIPVIIIIVIGTIFCISVDVQYSGEEEKWWNVPLIRRLQRVWVSITYNVSTMSVWYSAGTIMYIKNCEWVDVSVGKFVPTFTVRDLKEATEEYHTLFSMPGTSYHYRHNQQWREKLTVTHGLRNSDVSLINKIGRSKAHYPQDHVTFDKIVLTRFVYLNRGDNFTISVFLAINWYTGSANRTGSNWQSFRRWWSPRRLRSIKQLLGPNIK